MQVDNSAVNSEGESSGFQNQRQNSYKIDDTKSFLYDSIGPSKISKQSTLTNKGIRSKGTENKENSIYNSWYLQRNAQTNRETPILRNYRPSFDDNISITGQYFKRPDAYPNDKNRNSVTVTQTKHRAGHRQNDNYDPYMYKSLWSEDYMAKQKKTASNEDSLKPFAYQSMWTSDDGPGDHYVDKSNFITSTDGFVGLNAGQSYFLGQNYFEPQNPKATNIEESLKPFVYHSMWPPEESAKPKMDQSHFSKFNSFEPHNQFLPTSSDNLKPFVYHSMWPSEDYTGPNVDRSQYPNSIQNVPTERDNFMSFNYQSTWPSDKANEQSKILDYTSLEVPQYFATKEETNLHPFTYHSMWSADDLAQEPGEQSPFSGNTQSILNNMAPFADQNQWPSKNLLQSVLNDESLRPQSQNLEIPNIGQSRWPYFVNTPVSENRPNWGYIGEEERMPQFFSDNNNFIDYGVKSSQNYPWWYLK